MQTGSPSKISSPSLMTRRRMSALGTPTDLMKFDLPSPQSSPRKTPTLGECPYTETIDKAAAAQLNPSSPGIKILCKPKVLLKETLDFSLEIKELIQSGNYYLERIEGGGINHSYFLVDGKTSLKCAIFKLQLEELECAKRSRIGIRQGELCLTEAAVMELAQNSAGQKLVSFPTTILLNIKGKIVESNTAAGPRLAFKKSEDSLAGSFQKFIPNGSLVETLDKFSAKEVQRLALFDLLTLNTDRNHRNYLVVEPGQLIPIDHGCCFPAGFRDSCSYAWLDHPASYEALDDDLRNYALSLNPREIIATVRGYFSQPHLATLSDFQKVPYPSDKDPKFIEKRLQSLFFALNVVQKAIQRGMSLRQIALLFTYNQKFAEREISKEWQERITSLQGECEFNAGGRILEKIWEKIESAIDRNELLEPIIERELAQFFPKFDSAWEKIGEESSNQNFFKTPEGLRFLSLYQQEKLFEQLSK
jgi:Phosphatidylinositol 3- and 4-kinase